jgi:hypothetical protein
VLKKIIKDIDTGNVLDECIPDPTPETSCR